MLPRRSIIALPSRTRYISSSVARYAKAIIYSRNGEPADVLSVRSVPAAPAPAAGEIKIKFKLSPVNPADLNVIQGVYPAKPRLRSDLDTPEPVYIAGSEALAEVDDVGDGVDGLDKGDWVIMKTAQFGTWASEAVAKADDVIRVPRTSSSSISEVHAATMTVNPPTALALLRDFVELQPGDWVIQNGANSAVGQALIQVARRLRLKTINLVRDRDDIDDLKRQLQSLGADRVMTYSELADKGAKDVVKGWTEGMPIRLALNCVGGKDTTLMARFLGEDAHLISYGAMSKAPLSLPTSLFIFKNLTCHGYWNSRWYLQHSSAQRIKLVEELVDMVESGDLKEPAHEIVTLQGTDEDMNQTVHDVMTRGATGRLGKKVLFRFGDQ